MNHVLYVKDDEMLRNLAWGILTAMGHTVETVGTAEEALAWCSDAANEIGSVIIDLNSSRIGHGIELAGQIACIRPDAAITALSGGIRSLPAGMPATVRLLPKPMSVQRLHEAAQATAASAIENPCRAW
ncbi:hypothetical protein [Lichenifustis flavocetrariae]|uniref:Response regulatory domain-containing protein n=1 Tax=Lichenifustis flavocetrariae TaxID=2949735 RepID=A0AA41ZAH5_9HYPH|nr:hypothetical protein [Lichenifustis flavocetrariae]MCW6512297.1 hypothetical protein [Lichenifustis flavocetrariae]